MDIGVMAAPGTAGPPAVEQVLTEMLSRVPSAWKCQVMEMSSDIHSLDQKLQERVTGEPTVP